MIVSKWSILVVTFRRGNAKITIANKIFFMDNITQTFLNINKIKILIKKIKPL